MKKLFGFLLMFFGMAFSSFGQATDVDSDSIVFSKVETEATFPGGLYAFRNFLSKHLKADTPVRKRAPVGTYTVVVRFIVGKTGKISDISAETNHGYGMETEVIRVIKKSPDWIPAQQNGLVVNAYRRQPVTFVVSKE